MPFTASRAALLAAACAAAALGAWGCGHGAPPAAPQRPPVLVRLAAAERRDVPFTVRAPGLVLASETVEVHSRLDSEVVEVHFREGDAVKAGQLLFTLDDRALKADLGQQAAALATAEAEFANAARQYERARKLAAGGFESTAVLDEARAAHEGAEARIAATRAAIERLQVLLGYTRIAAAIDGRAGAVSATVGNTVKANDAGKPLVVINRVSPIRVRIGLPQQALAPLRARMERGAVETRVIRDGVPLDDVGRVEFIDNSINRTTATFECRAEFANATEALWPGMIVEVVLALGVDRDAVAVPEVAVQHTPAGDFVFVAEGGVARRRSVKVGRYGEGLAVVAEGLQGGEQVAVDGMLALSDGSPVEATGGPASQAADAAAGGASNDPAGAATSAPAGGR